jgi:hypothetical protein
VSSNVGKGGGDVVVPPQIAFPQFGVEPGNPHSLVLSFGVDEVASADPILVLVIVAIITYAILRKKP